MWHGNSRQSIFIRNRSRSIHRGHRQIAFFLFFTSIDKNHAMTKRSPIHDPPPFITMTPRFFLLLSSSTALAFFSFPFYRISVHQVQRYSQTMTTKVVIFLTVNTEKRGESESERGERRNQNWEQHDLWEDYFVFFLLLLLFSVVRSIVFLCVPSLRQSRRDNKTATDSAVIQLC